MKKENLELEIIDFDAQDKAEREIIITNPVKLRLGTTYYYGLMTALTWLVGVTAIHRIELTSLLTSVFMALGYLGLCWLTGILTFCCYPDICRRIGKKIPRYDVSDMPFDSFKELYHECQNLNLMGWAGVSAFAVAFGAIITIDLIAFLKPEIWYLSVAFGCIFSIGYAIVIWSSVVCDLIRFRREFAPQQYQSK